MFLLPLSNDYFNSLVALANYPMLTSMIELSTSLVKKIQILSNSKYASKGRISDNLVEATRSSGKSLAISSSKLITNSA